MNNELVSIKKDVFDSLKEVTSYFDIILELAKIAYENLGDSVEDFADDYDLSFEEVGEKIETAISLFEDMIGVIADNGKRN